MNKKIITLIIVLSLTLNVGLIWHIWPEPEKDVRLGGGFTPENIVPTIDSLILLGTDGQRSYVELLNLLRRARAAAVRNEFQDPITQGEVDILVQRYSPLYVTALTAVETAGDNLNTDPLH